MFGLVFTCGDNKLVATLYSHTHCLYIVLEKGCDVSELNMMLVRTVISHLKGDILACLDLWRNKLVATLDSHTHGLYILLESGCDVSELNVMLVGIVISHLKENVWTCLYLWRQQVSCNIRQSHIWPLHPLGKWL